MEAAALDQIVSAAADSGTDSRLAGVMWGLARRPSPPATVRTASRGWSATSAPGSRTAPADSRSAGGHGRAAAARC